MQILSDWLSGMAGEFLVQATAGIVSGLVVLLVQPLWMMPTRKKKQEPAGSATSSGGDSNNARGHQVKIDGNSTVGGDINIDGSTTITTIRNEVHEARSGSKDSDSGPDLVPVFFGALFAVVVVGSLFSLFWNVVLAAWIGAAIALAVRVLRSAAQTPGLAGKWPYQATRVCVLVLAALVAQAFAWVSIFAVEKGPVKLAQVIDDLRRAAEAHGGYGSLSGIRDGAIQAFVELGMPGMVHIAMLILGLFAAAALGVVAFVATLEWQASLRLMAGRKLTDVEAKRAQGFLEPKIGNDLLGILLLGAVMAACVTGTATELLPITNS